MTARHRLCRPIPISAFITQLPCTLAIRPFHHGANSAQVALTIHCNDQRMNVARPIFFPTRQNLVGRQLSTSLHSAPFFSTRVKSRPCYVNACASNAAQPHSGSSASVERKQQQQKQQQRDRSTLLLVGLGNPGPSFDGTPHNIGFHLVSSFASSAQQPKFKYMRQVEADVTTLCLHGVTVHVLKPNTFMNLSGRSVRLALNYWKLPPEALLVVTDDVALEVGRVRLRGKGSTGGHNGLKSIQAALNGSQEYARLRIGVGGPTGGAQYLKGFVLKKFNRADLRLLQDVEIDVLNLLDTWVQQPDMPKVISRLGTMPSGQRHR